MAMGIVNNKLETIFLFFHDVWIPVSSPLPSGRNIFLKNPSHDLCI